ncbi:phosphoadenosine phosphosulfate reductase family protein [Puia sp. P3]|uniref:phosphoadenosine phosphosulfate reductase domain-containing protein n=1 Tax=Puia sp. P3 TaxID=3423952 RepID=UPI003D67A380
MKFPAVSSNLLTRWCSSTVKIDVLHSVVAHHPLYQHSLVVLTGERRQESLGRSKYLNIDLYKANTKKRKAIQWRPVLEWPESAIWEIISRWHIQPHPAYMLGWNRCSCQMCIFSAPDIWATIASIDSGKIKKLRPQNDGCILHCMPEETF